MPITEIYQQNPQLSPIQAIIYALIRERIEDTGNFCRYTSAEITAITGISDRSIRTAVRALIDADLITTKRSGTYRLFSLPHNDDDPSCTPEPAKNTGTECRQQSAPAQNTGKNCRQSGISDLNNKNINKNNSSDISDKLEHQSKFASKEIRELPPEAVAPIRREYERLLYWRGHKPLYIGRATNGHKIAYMPAIVREHMRSLCADQIRRIILRYDPSRLDYSGIAWIQAALMHPWQSEPYGDMSPSAAPAPASTLTDSPQTGGGIRQPKKRNAFHNFPERKYDMASMEAMLLATS